MEWPDPELGPNSCGMCCVLFHNFTSLKHQQKLTISQSTTTTPPPPPPPPPTTTTTTTTATTTTTTWSRSIHVLINISHPESGSAITYITGYYIYNISTGQVRGFHHQTASYGEITWCHLSHLEHTSTKPHNIPSHSTSRWFSPRPQQTQYIYQIYHNHSQPIYTPLCTSIWPLPKSLHIAKNQAIRPVHFRSYWVLPGVLPWALPAPTPPPRQPHAGSGGVGSQRWTGWQQHCWRKLPKEATAVANSFGRAAPHCHAQAVGSPPTWPCYVGSGRLCFNSRWRLGSWRYHQNLCSQQLTFRQPTFGLVDLKDTFSCK